jgi:hypothetical protein
VIKIGEFLIKRDRLRFGEPFSRRATEEVFEVTTVYKNLIQTPKSEYFYIAKL